MSTLVVLIPVAMLALVLLAYAVLRWVDAPVRAYLTRALNRSKEKEAYQAVRP